MDVTNPTDRPLTRIREAARHRMIVVRRRRSTCNQSSLASITPLSGEMGGQRDTARGVPHNVVDVTCCRLWACYMLRPVGRVYVGILQKQAWRKEPRRRLLMCTGQKSDYVCGGGSPHTGHHPCLSRTKSEGVSYQCYMLSIGCPITPQRACAAEDGTRRLKRRVLCTFEEVSPSGVSFPRPLCLSC